jgi:DNA-binding NarL/FixJ family response regulator
MGGSGHRRHGLHALTAKEELVLPFLLAGTPDRVTAQRLHVSERAVRLRTASILRQFAVPSREALVALLR